MGAKSIKIGVIGAGGIANGVHLPSLKCIPRAELLWVSDIIEDRARAAAEKFGVRRYGTLYAPLIREDKPDAVFVLVEPDQSFRIARDCLLAGCHVFLEKPMGITLYQAETLARTARDVNRQCQVGFNRRFIPLIKTVLERMRALAPIHQADGWFFKNGDAAFYGGCASAFLCDTIHAIDLVRHAIGAEATHTMQLAARVGNSPVDNAWNALIAFENGAVGTVRANYMTGGRVHGLAIHNPLASAYVDLGFGGEGCAARILHHVEGTFSISARGAGEQHIEALDGTKIAGGGEYFRYYGYLAEDEAFIDALFRGRGVDCSADDALKTMYLTEQLTDAQRRA